MDVYEAVKSRRAVRGFKDEPVRREVLERVLSAAAWSPSGSNIQPWNTYVLTGAPLTALKTPYGERRAAFGKDRYSALGIAGCVLNSNSSTTTRNFKHHCIQPMNS